MFVLLFLFLSSFLSSARAEELPVTVNVTYAAPVVTDEADYGLKVPSSYNGVSLVIGSGCKVAVVGKNLSPKMVGRLAGEVMKAKTDCLAAKAEHDDKDRADKVAADRSISMDKLLVSAGAAGEKGSNVRVVTPEATVEMGPHLEWKAFGEASRNGNGYVPGMPLDYVAPDQALIYRLSAGQAALATHPTVPGAVMPTQSAAASTETEAELRRALEAKDALIRELSGS